MKFVIGFILILLVILAEVQKEKMTMLMSNNLVKLAMLLSIVFIFKTKNIILGVISGLVFLCLLVMTSKPLQEGFNNHGESNSLDDEEHMHVVEKLRGKNRGKSCSNLKLVPYKKNQKHSKHQGSHSESIEESKHDKEGKPKSKTSRLCVEELLHKGNINSININFDRTSRGKEPVAVCPPGFKGPNKKGDCTARWYDGCGYECHKKKCEAYGGSFSDHDFGGNLNYKCVPSMLSEFGDLKEETVNETITMKNNGKGKMKAHTHSTEFSAINSRLDGMEDSMEGYNQDERFSSLEEKLDSLAQRFASDSTPANVRSMTGESGRGSQSTTQPESAAGMMASTEEATAEEEAAAAEEAAAEEAAAEEAAAEEAAAEEAAAEEAAAEEAAAEEAAAEEEKARAEREEAEANRKAEQAAAAQRKEQEEEEKRKAEEARLKKEEAERKAEEARLKKEEAERKAEEAKRKADRMSQENKQTEPSSNISTNGKCGKQGNNKICPANEYCSLWGWCGTSNDHKNNSQAKFNGITIQKPESSSNISTNGKCGKQGNNKICPANEYCSKWGWCGTSNAHKNNSQTKFNGSTIRKPEEKFKKINNNQAMVMNGASFKVTPLIGSTITALSPVKATPDPSGDAVYKGLSLPIFKGTSYGYCVNKKSINLLSGGAAMNKCGGLQNYSPLTFDF